MRDSIWEEPYDARSLWERKNDEHRQNIRGMYPGYDTSRSGQFSRYMKDAAADWPASVVIPMWFGCVLRWLSHPSGGEEETFRDATEEIARLREERK